MDSARPDIKHQAPADPTLDESDSDPSIDPIDPINSLLDFPIPPFPQYTLDTLVMHGGFSDPMLHIDSEAVSPASEPSESWTRSNVKTSLSDRSQSHLQNFLVFFGDELIQTSRAKTWMAHSLAHNSTKEIEKRLSDLLKNYSENMKLKYPAFKPSNTVANKFSGLLCSTIALVSCYRANIATYFWKNSIANATPLPRYLGTLDLQDTLVDWMDSLRDSEFCQGHSVRTPSSAHTKSKWTDQNGIVQEEDLGMEFYFVKNILVSSGAFKQLAYKMRRNLCFNDRRELKAISQILTCSGKWPHRFRSQICRVSFWIHWNISGFMHSQYNELVPVATVVTLTGSALYAQATTCGEYIRTNWPTIGPAFLDIMDRSLASKHHGTIRVNSGLFLVQYDVLPMLTYAGQASDNRSLWYEIEVSQNSTHWCVRTASERLVEDLAQLFAWVGSALSISPFGEKLAYARPLLKTLPREPQKEDEYCDPTTIDFDLSFESTALNALETACWLPLFKRASIASGFPIPERAQEIGLEVPLEILAELAGVRQAIEFEGGIILKGFAEMFVPVKKTGDRVQWHAIISEDNENRLTFGEGLSRCESRALLDEVSFGDLKSTRAIVGWCCAATSRLGSDAANYENIDYSGAKQAGLVLRCAGGQIGVQQIGTGILDFRLGAKDGNFHVPRLGRYSKIVSASEKTPIMLYGTKEQRSWLVFASDVLLHMIQHRHRLDPFKVEGKTVRLDTTVTPGSSAKTILMKNEKSRISDEQDYTFKTLVVDIWGILESLVDQNTRRSQNMSGAPVKASFQEVLQGYEYNAVVEDRSPFILKEQELNKTSGGWPSLIRDINALVLFADSFGEVILPTDSAKSSLCRSWHTMPSGMDYMATTSKVLKDLYSVAGCRTTRSYLSSTQLRWHRGESLVFEACADTLACRCNRLQQIIPKASIGFIVPPGLLEDEGAVIFGKSGSLLQGIFSMHYQRPVQITGIYSQPNIPLRSTSSSENSSRTGSDGTAESVSTSLSSSCPVLPVQTMLSEIPEIDEIAKPPASSKRRLCLADSPFEISDKDAEHYKAFERLREPRVGKRR
jgi:hypothetical protein